MNGFRSFMVTNPLAVFGPSLQAAQRELRYYLKLPDPAQSGKGAALPAEQRESRADRQRFRKRHKLGQRAQYSQIHLIREATQERSVVHIGTIIGRSVSDFTLQRPDHRTAYLKFAQVDPQEYKAPILLSYIAGEATVKVNGVEVRGDTPLPNDARIQVDDQEYGVQLFAWDRAPIATRVDAGWSTDVGPNREDNQDAIGIYQHQDAYLFVIADGVGTGQYGEIVSEFAVRYLLAVFHKNVKYHLRWDAVLRKAFETINTEVRHFARYSPSSEGSTLTAVVIKGGEAHIAHVGDSRLYHWHEGFMRQVTTDHIGEIEIEQDTRHAAEAPEPVRKKDVLAKAVGKADAISPDIFSLSLQPEDRLLLCTDGLTGVMTDDELAEAFPTKRAERLPAHLVQVAGQRDAKDNLTAVVIDVLKEGFVEDTWLAENSDRVYAGYNRSWPLRLARPRDLYTSYPVKNRPGCWVTVGVVAIMLLALAFILRSVGGTNTAASDAIASPGVRASVTAQVVEATRVSPTSTEFPTENASLTPAPTRTPFPAVTRIPVTPTEAVSPTPLPPTSTLRPASASLPLPSGRI
jgi:protein phosphatase